MSTANRKRPRNRAGKGADRGSQRVKVGFVERIMGSSTAIATAAAFVGAPLVAFAVYFIADGMSGHAVSASNARTIANISWGTAEDERSIIQTQETADLRTRILDETLSQTEKYQAGDQIACAGETVWGTILTFSDVPSERDAGQAMQASCHARAERGGAYLRDQIERSLRIKPGH